MQGQIALVTGAGAGIGQAIARRLAHEGAAVVVADIDQDAGAETVRQIAAEGGRAACIRADVAVEADVQAMIAFAEQRFGGLDILVNNVGIASPPYFPEAAPAHWGRTLDVNLRGVMLSIQFSTPAMRQRGGGLIVNISSLAGIGYRPYHAPEYAASKAAMARLTAALGYLKDQAGIRVNCICPGWVATAQVQRYLAGATPEELAVLDYPPPPVLIQPEQIAEAVVMFIQDDTLAGRVMIWPDGKPWQLIALDAEY
jgi:NAD(P)-dependent dehydrogenase (short-subunit alcohol dehydrogenase family)